MESLLKMRKSFICSVIAPLSIDIFIAFFANDIVFELYGFILDEYFKM